MRKTILVVLFLLFLFSLSSCNDNKSDMVFSVEPPCLDHKFGDWTIITEPTTKAEGLKQRVCQSCGFFENKKFQKNTVSYSTNENGNKVLEVKIPFNPHEDNQNNNVTDTSSPIKIVIDESEKTITIEGDSLPPNTKIDDVKSNIEQTLKDNNIILDSDFDFDVKIPGYEDNEDLTPSPY